MDPLTLLLYVGTLWRDAEPGSDLPYVPDAALDGPIPPYCTADEQDADFPWLDMYTDVWDTQEEPK